MESDQVPRGLRALRQPCGRLLVPSGKLFYDKSMLQLRLEMVKYRSEPRALWSLSLRHWRCICQESLEIKRRHAFMLAGTMLNEYSILVDQLDR